MFLFAKSRQIYSRIRCPGPKIVPWEFVIRGGDVLTWAINGDTTPSQTQGPGTFWVLVGSGDVQALI